MKKILLSAITVFLFAALHAQTPDSTLQQYVGKYTFPEGSVITEAIVTLEGSSLSVTSSAGPSPLEKQGEDLFSITQFQGTAKFNRNANKKVIGVSIEAMGYKLEGTKVDGALAQLPNYHHPLSFRWLAMHPYTENKRIDPVMIEAHNAYWK